MKCSYEEAISISLDEYLEKYYDNIFNSTSMMAGHSDMRDSKVNSMKNYAPKPMEGIESKAFQVNKFNHKNYWRNNGKRKNNFCNNFGVQHLNTGNNKNHNKTQLFQYSSNNHQKARKTRWNTPKLPYNQLLQNYNILSKHIPSLLDLQFNPSDFNQNNVSNTSSTTAVMETKRSSGGGQASINELSTLADHLLKKFDKLYDIRQSIKVEQEKQKKYNIPIQKEIATIQNKPLYVKCPNAEVVTCDGPGVECNMKPHSTDLSLNMRFA